MLGPASKRLASAGARRARHPVSDRVDATFGTCDDREYDSHMTRKGGVVNAVQQTVLRASRNGCQPASALTWLILINRLNLKQFTVNLQRRLYCPLRFPGTCGCRSRQTGAYKASPRNPAGVWGRGASVVPDPTVNRVTFTCAGFDPNQAATQS